MDDRDRLVAIYLQDHLAGSVAALELVERAARANAGNELGSFLTDLHGEISADKETLLATMRTLGVDPSRVKNAVAWTAEKAARLKANGGLLRYSPLSRVHELEALEAGGGRSGAAGRPALSGLVRRRRALAGRPGGTREGRDAGAEPGRSRRVRPRPSDWRGISHRIRGNRARDTPTPSARGRLGSGLPHGPHASEVGARGPAGPGGLPDRLPIAP